MSAFLHELRDYATPTAVGTPTLHQLAETPDEQWALTFNRGPTDPLSRWGQGVLTLLTRGPRSNPDIVDDRADPVVKVLLDAAGRTFGGVGLNTIDHRGSSSGADSSKRTLRIDTFLLDLDYQA
jgi:hypothetical protein